MGKLLMGMPAGKQVQQQQQQQTAGAVAKRLSLFCVGNASLLRGSHVREDRRRQARRRCIERSSID